jgi:hypothetical protein
MKPRDVKRRYKMEFLRFGSHIPGVNHGCCAFDIIQNFNRDPDEKASIQLVSGDGGYPLSRPVKGQVFAGPTYRDIFNTRLRIGTFSDRDLPNHGFLAILTETQLTGTVGRKWLAILKEAGFEFVRTVDNSVYEYSRGRKNYLFALFRNVGKNAVHDPFAPPKEWTDLPEQTKSQKEIWNALPPANFMSEAELVKANVPVTMAGLKSKHIPCSKAQREANLAKEKPFTQPLPKALEYSK